ncbi:hypothetical protein NWP22_10010 [Anabaenopsis tanganyikae CS-531]|uniref:Uncharacterized protein n=1 Tax=Anabaenopsis tanganyikae CS-531 TaxID=2785304 RepID=A0ABT6KEB5_9CYAN|nr:hypothetical protein [Anabaenopsis tanganyikae]MDH6106196.1 hypothetical protein [Anabaenopsis tanganyikae CS-531]
MYQIFFYFPSSIHSDRSLVQSPINSHPSTVTRQQSTVNRQQSTVNSQQ